jgi:hypothetical protein
MQNLISFILLKGMLHYAIQIGRVNGLQRAMTTFLHAISAVEEKSSFFPRLSVFLL